MEALLLLEHSIDNKWRRQAFRDVYFSCLPSWAHALKYATIQSLTLRIWSLDRLLDYSRLDSDTSFQSRKAKGAVGSGGRPGSSPAIEYLPKPTPSNSRKRAPAPEALPLPPYGSGGNKRVKKGGALI